MQGRNRFFLYAWVVGSLEVGGAALDLGEVFKRKEALCSTTSDVVKLHVEVLIFETFCTKAFLQAGLVVGDQVVLRSSLTKCEHLVRQAEMGVGFGFLVGLEVSSHFYDSF